MINIPLGITNSIIDLVAEGKLTKCREGGHWVYRIMGKSSIPNSTQKATHYRQKRSNKRIGFEFDAGVKVYPLLDVKYPNSNTLVCSALKIAEKL